MEKRIQLCTVSGNLNWYHCYGNQYGVLPETKIGLPYDISIPSVSIYWIEMKSLSWWDILTPIFTAASFTIFKIWKYTTNHLLQMDKFVKIMLNVLSDTEKRKRKTCEISHSL